MSDAAGMAWAGIFFFKKSRGGERKLNFSRNPGREKENFLFPLE